jgi:hypothetical protein
MKNAMDTIKSWAWGFIDLMLIFIAVGVLVQVIFGDGAGWFDGVVGRLMGLVSEFSSGGFVGLIALVIVLSLFNKRTA